MVGIQNELLLDRNHILQYCYGVTKELFDSKAREDQKDLHSRFKLDVSPRMQELLFMQTQTGHAKEGHGKYFQMKNCGYGKTQVHRIKIDDVSLEDITRALGENPEGVKQERMAVIDDIKIFLNRLVDGERLSQVHNEHGEPIGGLNYFRDMKFDPSKAMDIVAGYIEGGFMDSIEHRMMLDPLYASEGARLQGGGCCVAIDLLNMHKWYWDTKDTAFTIDRLSKIGHDEDDMQWLADNKIISLEDVQSDQRMISGYIRRRVGPGGSDDAAIVSAGLYNGCKERSIGVFLADQVDTLDKFVPTIKAGGYDEYLARELEEKCPGLVETKDKLRLIYMASMNNFDDPEVVFDYSQRYMVQISHGASSIERYLRYFEDGCSRHYGGFFEQVEDKAKRAKSIDFSQFV